MEAREASKCILLMPYKELVFVCWDCCVNVGGKYVQNTHFIPL